MSERPGLMGFRAPWGIRGRNVIISRAPDLIMSAGMPPRPVVPPTPVAN